jgi:NAD(P)-dependent dehydrogenase (short-subunit alcohol dehydrogenase family)
MWGLRGPAGGRRRSYRHGGAGQGKQVPLGRLSRPEEIATAILFLASDDASYVSRATLPVDGAIRAVLTPPTS